MEGKELTPKERLKIPPQKMPEQDPKKRIHNVDEVPFGYDEKLAQTEAMRCLQCKKAPCIKGCPVEIDIPAFIQFIAEGKYREAINKIKETNILPAVCGRVCPQEEQCQKTCLVGKSHKSIEEAVQLSTKVCVITPRPGRIDRVFDIDLPWPRDLQVKRSPAFAEYARQIEEIFHGSGVL